MTGSCYMTGLFAVADFSERLQRLVLLQDYNTRVVLTGTMLLGIAAGVVGVFLVLRKRALVGDVIGHAALPGIAAAYLIAELIAPGTGRSSPILLTGAAVSGTVGGLCVTAITRYSRVKDDAAMAVVLGVFFGLGAVLFSIVQQVPGGQAAGLNSLLFGKTASMLSSEVWTFGAAAGIVLLICLLMHKELVLLCFDPSFLGSLGHSIVIIDVILMTLVVGVTVIGIQSVGLILVVAALVIPASAARFWTDQVGRMTILAGVFGGLGAGVGVVLSALFPRLAAGALIVLAASAVFFISLIFGSRRGFLPRLWQQHRLARSVARDHLLRGCFEIMEADGRANFGVGGDALSQVEVSRLKYQRDWNDGRLRSVVKDCSAKGYLRSPDGQHILLTSSGLQEAQRLTRNHRLWEIYLLEIADADPAKVDRAADRIEHVLDPALVADLERRFAKSLPERSVPPSPHPVA
ncbi:metal ABC transporter permease [Stratiformator vulcanicus]|uniref:Manganese transport system membrane protein MntB n=1 Tax=Stratiformator vulcanicus TaxID=2527980 RepID=A0A517QZ94_9PLAN|nr:metal ABC transporter permease [Stratiformator vulcanicus]QDT36966.1 Manganese transport system membrane protein MntB [Stratiformator vulcanicus]